MTKAILSAGPKSTARDFDADNIKGKYGEYLVQKYLKTFFEDKYNTMEDKSDDPRYQKADIDLLVQLDGRPVQGIEIKNDNTLHPNLFFETVSVVRKHAPDSPGCMIVSEADALYYVFEPTGIAVVCSLSKLREWVIYYKGTGAWFKEVPVYNEKYQAKGIPLPVKKMMGMDPHCKGVGAVKLIDIETNTRITYEEFDRRRLDMLKKSGGEFNVEVEKDPAWLSKLNRLAPNKNVLNIPLRTEFQRRSYANTYIKEIRA